MYTNDRIKKLLEDRNRIDYEIQKEIEKIKATRKFSWKRFFLMVGTFAFIILMLKLNAEVFPKTSIWSWGYYIK